MSFRRCYRQKALLLAFLFCTGLSFLFAVVKQTNILSGKSTFPVTTSLGQNDILDGREERYIHNYSLFGLIPGIIKRTQRIQTLVSTAFLYTFPSSLLDGKFDSDLSVKAELMSVAMSGRPRLSRQGSRYFDLVLRTYVKNAKTTGKCQRSYLLKLSVNASYDPVDRGHFLGIPAVIYGKYGGPEDARMFDIDGDAVIVYSMIVEGSLCRMFLYNIDTDEGPVKIKVDGLRLQRWEKNWVPITLTERERSFSHTSTDNKPLDKTKTFFLVYSLLPVVLLRCDFPSAVCKAHDPKLEFSGKSDLNASNQLGSGTRTRPATSVRETIKSKPDGSAERRLRPGELRNGTPFLHYKNGLHIALVHRLHNKTYSIHLLVYSTKIYEIIYVSDPVNFHRDVYFMAPKTIRFHPFIYPTSLILKDTDTLHIGAHVNDGIAIILKMTGIKDLMETLLKQDFRSGLSEEDIERHLKANDY